MLTLTFVAVLLVLAWLLYLTAPALFGLGGLGQARAGGCANSGCFVVPPNGFIYISEDNNQILCDNDQCPGPQLKRRLKVINNTNQRGFVIGYKAGSSAGGKRRIASLDARIEEFDCRTCTYVDTRRLKKITMYRECNERPC